jgi:hypothetical protein
MDGAPGEEVIQMAIELEPKGLDARFAQVYSIFGIGVDRKHTLK